MPTPCPFLGEWCPMEIGKEQPLPFKVPPVCGVRAPRGWRRAGDHEENMEVSMELQRDKKKKAEHL